MGFNFIDEDEDEDFITFEDEVFEDEWEIAQQDDEEAYFQFTQEIPTKRSVLTDPEVQAKARQGRRNRKTKNKTYEGKRDDGWSYACAHKDHLPNLCEREQTREGINCDCPCHVRRGFDLDAAIRRYEDEEVIDFSD